jgi:hypothetical protein
MLKDILAISGQPGLHKLVSNTKNGVIVENLETKKRMPAYATSKISALEDIAIYTEDGDDKPLVEVFRSIREKEEGKATISHKVSGKELENFFSDILPDYDKDRVYSSDIKKVVQWYNTLQKLDMLNVLDEQEEEAESSDTETKEENAE